MSIIIRPTQNKQDMEAVYRLVYKEYFNEGYCLERANGSLRHYTNLDGIPETTVLVAVEDGVIVGTNSLTLDGIQGLHVDHDFKEIVDEIRREQRRLAASWRIVTDSEHHKIRKVVMGLIQETINIAVKKGVQTTLFIFHPKHEEVYKKILAMQTIGRKNENGDTLINAPAVLMRLDRENLPKRWLRGR